ncbi:Flp family type IVb pilin [Solimonas soli]|uniref:Flp family type IVb pilin n=1 Tax=Solimonas soli TaxID=413479 RepID=UPI0004AE9916|nr:Flp family type IVb pilin [Solimonas soli]
MLNRIAEFMRDEEGASAVEYGLIVALIAVIIVGVVTILGTNVRGVFNHAANSIGGG